MQERVFCESGHGATFRLKIQEELCATQGLSDSDIHVQIPVSG